MAAARVRDRRRNLLAPGINLTPLLDAILNMIFFFLIATNIRNQEFATKINLPASETAEAADEAPLAVTVDSEGRLFYEGAEIVEEELELRLRAEAGKGKTAIAIRGDADGRFGKIYEILDLCRRAGMSGAFLQAQPKAPAAQ